MAPDDVIRRIIAIVPKSVVDSSSKTKISTPTANVDPKPMSSASELTATHCRHKDQFFGGLIAYPVRFIFQAKG
jgi:hypothetical protein